MSRLPCTRHPHPATVCSPRRPGRRLISLLALVLVAPVVATASTAPAAAAAVTARVTVSLTTAGPANATADAALVQDPQVAPATGVWPLRPRPRVVEGFDPPATRWGSGHRGVDLAGRAGASVRATLAGRVTFAGRLAGRGVVVVEHRTTRTTYEPVSATVRVGERVGAGAVLGRLQLFGSHCFPRWCLHWGLIEGREHYLDPLTLVGAAPVRLLPLWSGLPAFGLPGPVGPVAPVAALTPWPRPPSPQARGWAWR